jgi:hypothetical protein
MRSDGCRRAGRWLRAQLRISGACLRSAVSLRRPPPPLLNPLLQPPQQFRHADPQRSGDHHQCQDGGVLQPPLNIPDESPVQAAVGGKIVPLPSRIASYATRYSF